MAALPRILLVDGWCTVRAGLANIWTVVFHVREETDKYWRFPCAAGQDVFCHQAVLAGFGGASFAVVEFDE